MVGQLRRDHANRFGRRSSGNSRTTNLAARRTDRRPNRSHFPPHAHCLELGMRYLVRARLKPGKEADLLDAIERGTLGMGSVAGREYLRNMQSARLYDD